MSLILWLTNSDTLGSDGWTDFSYSFGFFELINVNVSDMLNLLSFVTGMSLTNDLLFFEGQVADPASSAVLCYIHVVSEKSEK